MFWSPRRSWARRCRPHARPRGLTQSALAGRLGLSQSRVSHLELNAHALSLEQLLALYAALGLQLTIGTRGDAHAASSTHAEW